MFSIVVWQHTCARPSLDNIDNITLVLSSQYRLKRSLRLLVLSSHRLRVPCTASFISNNHNVLKFVLSQGIFNNAQLSLADAFHRFSR